MKNELRIGNWVLDTYFPVQDGYPVGYTKDIQITKGSQIDASHYKPIPLTEEWLERFGFISDPCQDMYIKGWLKINCDKTRGKLEFWVENVNGKVVYIEFVHTLQNLYFALTGQELELNKGKTR